ncbi:MAG TPA: tripartite tricarboxylate transporter substrate-binding protein [Xanthobacteraceae bacterium]|nr:tripartite tricarboxylate transporter substrate-binding protein [Xanthobacteraceae bacterium]
MSDKATSPLTLIDIDGQRASVVPKSAKVCAFTAHRPMKRRYAVPRIALGLAAAVTSAAPAYAADGDSFFAGKAVRIVVGFSPGGGYDLYARELGRYLGRHIPGNPSVVVQNMAGAGSLKAVNFLFNAAPRDGTVLATFARGIVFEPLIGRLDGAQFDAPKFNWIGSVSDEVSVCAINASLGIVTWQDMLIKKTVIGASGAGADSDVFPIVLRNLFHLPMRIVTGYPGGADLNLAMERGEIDGRCGWSWTSIVSRNRDWLTNKRIRITLQIALAKHEDLPDVPLVTELVSDLRQVAALKLIVSRQSIARPFAAPPEVPVERVETLRQAFDSTMRDPDFLAEMRSQSLEVHPVGGTEVQKLMRDVYASPPEVMKLARDILVEAP